MNVTHSLVAGVATALGGDVAAAAGAGRAGKPSSPPAALADGLVTGGAAALAAAMKPPKAGSAAARRRTSSGAGYAKASAKSTGKAATASKAGTKKASSTPKKAGPLAFLDDPKMSIEEKLARFVAHASSALDKKLDRMMKEARERALAKKQASSSGTSGGTKKKGGLLGSVVNVLSVAGIPGLPLAVEALQNKTVQQLAKTVTGPVLAAGATALGFPQAAPFLLKLGPSIADGAVSLAKAIDAGERDDAKAAAGGAASSSASGTPSSGTVNGEELEISKEDMFEIQRVVDRQKEMFSLVSNVLRAMHDTKMAVIQNVRG